MEALWTGTGGSERNRGSFDDTTRVPYWTCHQQPHIDYASRPAQPGFRDIRTSIAPTMASDGLAADGQPGSSERGSALEQRKILILYGSETGNSQEAAEDLERMAMRLHFETYLFELNEVKPVRPRICVLFACLSASHRGKEEQDTCVPIWYLLESNLHQTQPRSRAAAQPRPVEPDGVASHAHFTLLIVLASR